MNIDPKRLGLAVFAVALLGGCTFNSQGHLVPTEPELGEASHQTFAAQVVDPDPHYAAPETSSGDQAERAEKAYREGTIKERNAPSPTAGISGSGSGSGGGGSR